MSRPNQRGIKGGDTLRWNLNVPVSLVADAASWLGPGSLEALGAAVEQAGFDAVSVTDHPLPATDWLAGGGHHALDPFVALSFLAAGTSGLRLLTNVLVLPYRDPVITAKAIASLDVLSGGRLIVGTAIGYLREEFEAVHADYATRAAAFERAVVAMKETWATDGAGGGLPGHMFLPAPRQQPHPPLWVGGNSGAARRRAVTLGDGWMPFGQSAATSKVTGTPALESVEQLTAQIRALDEARRAAGRPAPLDVCFGLPRRSSLHRPDASAGEIDDEVGRYAQAGVTWLTVSSRAAVPADLQLELHRWAPFVGAGV